ncbi:hypothetical protein CVT25_007968 [Psilocybe cyanescens]|uniref:PB1 domain-containing protein n=1 Tax=Psilocybe cyanescens TaxID=93625 RepID=A0A409XN43_PSICY|nr:hypothetical protein CVT25_007968 [Psilocybe cyanescens]
MPITSHCLLTAPVFHLQCKAFRPVDVQMPSRPLNIPTPSPSRGRETIRVNHTSELPGLYPRGRASSTKRANENSLVLQKSQVEPDFSPEIDRASPSQRDRNDTTFSTLLSCSTQPYQASKPFCCPNPGCSRTFTNITGLNYHANQGNCNPLNQLLLSSPLSTTKVKTASDDIKRTGSKSVDRLRNKIMKLVRKSKGIRKDRRRSPAKSPPKNNDSHNDIERGRSRARKYLSASAPNLHISPRSISPQLAKHPPPPPLVSKKYDSDGQQQQQQEQERRAQRRLRQLKRQEKNKIRQELWARKMEEDHSEEEWANSGFNILQSRPLLMNRLSERKYILPRYSRSPNSSQPSSIHDAPVALSHSNKLKDRSKTFPPPARTLTDRMLSLPTVSSSRLAKPLPLPSNIKLLRQCAARECEWGKLLHDSRKNALGKDTAETWNRYITRTLPSHYSRRRRPSPHPSSGRSLKSTNSRSSSRSSFSFLPSIPDAQHTPDPPSRPHSSRPSSISFSSQSSISSSSQSSSRSRSCSSFRSSSPLFPPVNTGSISNDREPRPLLACVKIRVHFQEKTFLMAVLRTIDYFRLLERLEKNLSQCGYHIVSRLQLQYEDRNGNLIPLHTTKDVQMMFQHFPPQPVGQYIELFATYSA